MAQAVGNPGNLLVENQEIAHRRGSEGPDLHSGWNYDGGIAESGGDE